MFTRFTDALRGARKAEIFIILVLAAVIALVFICRPESIEGSTDLERRLESALKKISGAGNVQVMITQDQNENIIGILIIAEGAGEIPVKLEMLRAVKTLMGVEASQVEITQMRGESG